LQIIPTTYYVKGPGGFYNASLRVEHPRLYKNLMGGEVRGSQRNASGCKC